MKKLIIIALSTISMGIYADYHVPRPSHMDEKELMKYNNQKSHEFSNNAYNKVKNGSRKELKEQYESAKEQAKETYEAAKEKAKEAYEAAKEKTQEAYESAKEYYQQGKDTLSEKYKQLMENNN